MYEYKVKIFNKKILNNKSLTIKQNKSLINSELIRLNKLIEKAYSDGFSKINIETKYFKTNSPILIHEIISIIKNNNFVITSNKNGLIISWKLFKKRGVK